MFCDRHIVFITVLLYLYANNYVIPFFAGSHLLTTSMRDCIFLRLYLSLHVHVIVLTLMFIFYFLFVRTISYNYIIDTVY